MKENRMLEEILAGHGAQGTAASDFIKGARVYYRRRRNKGKGRDMLIGTKELCVAYCRMDLAKLLTRSVTLDYQEEDIRDVMRRMFYLTNIEELKFSEIKYDKKKRKFFVRVSADRSSDVFVGGARVHVIIRHLRIPISICDLSTTIQLPIINKKM